VTAKPISIKGTGGKSGGRVSKAVEFISEICGRLGIPDFLTEGEEIHSDPAAEVSSGP
jgi:hypothetical protein